jgi:hypothetical protein
VHYVGHYTISWFFLFPKCAVHGPSFLKLFVVRCWENIWPLDGEKLPEPGDKCIMRTFPYLLKHVIEGKMAETRRRGKRLRSYRTALRRRETLEFESGTRSHCVENWLGRGYEPVVRQPDLLHWAESRNPPHFIEPEGSLPHSQVPAICFYPEPAQSSPYPNIRLPEDPPYYYPPIYAWVSPVVSFPQVFPPTPCTHLYSPIRASCSAMNECSAYGREGDDKCAWNFGSESVGGVGVYGKLIHTKKRNRVCEH